MSSGGWHRRKSRKVRQCVVSAILSNLFEINVRLMYSWHYVQVKIPVEGLQIEKHLIHRNGRRDRKAKSCIKAARVSTKKSFERHASLLIYAQNRGRSSAKKMLKHMKQPNNFHFVFSATKQMVRVTLDRFCFFLRVWPCSMLLRICREVWKVIGSLCRRNAPWEASVQLLKHWTISLLELDVKEECSFSLMRSIFCYIYSRVSNCWFNYFFFPPFSTAIE